MKRSEAIKNLLQARTHADLAGLYNPNMEVQINVAQDNGIRVDGDYKGRQWHGWSDNIETWKPFRIPANAKTNPSNNDFDINYNLAAHVEGIGLTGWDWENRLSLWVGFDFDSIIGHAATHDKKIPESELTRIQELVSNIPWITIRQSTGGHGLHLYVFLNPSVPTANHTEHAALARAILGLLAGITAYDFKSKVDAMGSILWFWHRKMINNPSGLRLLKTGLPLTEVPINWKDHINVVSGKSKKIVPSFVTEQKQVYDIERLFNEITNSKTRVPLDADHQKLIQWLHDNHCHSWYDQDLNMLVTHTIHLKKAHIELGFKGVFETTSPGSEPDEQNCFMYAMRRGAWVVRRYTPGVAEAQTWSQDSHGYTRCFYNQEPDFNTAVKSCNAIEHKTGGFVFREAEVATKSLSMLGVHMQLPNWIMTRATKVKEQKDGRILVEIAHDANDRANEMEGWLAEKNNWTRIFNRNINTITEPDTGNYDDIVRHLITETGDDYGWLLKTNEQWRSEPLIHIRTFLKSLNLKLQEVDVILGSCISKPWRVVCRPFEPEILGDRDWNRHAPQLAYTPTITDTLSHPTWTKLLNHLGNGLNDAIKENKWAKDNGVLTGADYLKCWIASLFKEPREPLPYLFFYGDQNSGKSTLHEAIGLLLTSGVVRADNALCSQQGFNGELENAVLAVVEETNLKADHKAYARIKDWTTSRHLPIHKKNETPYSVINTVKFIQCANEVSACPIFPGDARIVVIKVDTISEIIPKKQLIIDLEKEANDFMASVLNVELPLSGDRLNIPVIMTNAKLLAEGNNQSDVEAFFKEQCHYVQGSYIKYDLLYEKFTHWLDPNEVYKWTKIKFGREIPDRYLKGASGIEHNQTVVANISFDPDTPPAKRFVLVDGKIMRERP